MKILVELKNIDFLDDYIEIDGLIVNTKYSISPNPLYIDFIKKIIDWVLLNKKELIFRIDKIFDDETIEECISFINDYLDLDFIKFVFTDFGIFHYFKELNKTDKLYYFAQTYLCSSKDIVFFSKENVKCLISNELSIEEINENLKNSNVGILAYGYFPIFYTKREVLSLYKDYLKDKNIDINLLKNHVYDLREELRDDKYKIYEGTDYSVIYSSKKMMIDLKILNEFKNVSFLYLSNFFISDLENKEMIDYYVNIRDGKVVNNKLSMNSNDYFTSFLYKKNEILSKEVK